MHFLGNCTRNKLRMLKHGVLVIMLMLTLQLVNGTTDDEQSPIIEAEEVLILVGSIGESSLSIPSSSDQDNMNFYLPPVHPPTTLLSVTTGSSPDSTLSRESSGDEIYEKTRSTVNIHFAPETETEMLLEDARTSRDEQQQSSTLLSQDREQDNLIFKHELQSPKPPPAALSRESMLRTEDDVATTFVGHDDAQTPEITEHMTTLHISPDTVRVTDDMQTPDLSSRTITTRSTASSATGISATSLVGDSEGTVFFPASKKLERKKKKKARLVRIETPDESPEVVLRWVRKNGRSKAKAVRGLLPPGDL